MITKQSEITGFQNPSHFSWPWFWPLCYRYDPEIE